MKKGLAYILLSILATSGLLLSPDSMAERVSNEAVYTTDPSDNDTDGVVYPNPATSHVFIRPGQIDPVFNEHSFDFEIRSILGNIMPVSFEKAGDDSYRIDTNKYPAGYYLLVLRCNDCQSNERGLKKVFKFLKQ